MDEHQATSYYQKQAGEMPGQNKNPAVKSTKMVKAKEDAQ
jgi:hypothetical protein